MAYCDGLYRGAGLDYFHCPMVGEPPIGRREHIRPLYVRWQAQPGISFAWVTVWPSV